MVAFTDSNDPNGNLTEECTSMIMAGQGGIGLAYLTSSYDRETDSARPRFCLSIRI